MYSSRGGTMWTSYEKFHEGSELELGPEELRQWQCGCNKWEEGSPGYVLERVKRRMWLEQRSVESS